MKHPSSETRRHAAGPEPQMGLLAPESMSASSPPDPGNRSPVRAPAGVPPDGDAPPRIAGAGDSAETTAPLPGLVSNGENRHYETSGMLALIERVVLDPAADVEKLERLLALQERILERNDKLAFNAAKGRILKKLAGIKIVKSRAVLYEQEKGRPSKGLYEAFKYAPLEDIDKVLAPLLAGEEMDLAYSNESAADGRVLIRGRLKHLPGGHYEDSFMPAPLDTSGGKNNVQAVGSTNSYLRRYIACNLFNIVVVGDDDDARTAEIFTPEQAKEIVGLIRKAKSLGHFNAARFAKAMNWPFSDGQSIEGIVSAAPIRDYRKAKSMLEEHLVIERMPGNV